ncbi:MULTISPECIES: hypothetical protein [Elizabethkingia]|uniref:hypothetical protein n=1 Tax=Elizabethkingia TaxID=308865 RepID=UPI0021A2B03E|nr:MULTISPECIES: hypothetical protein [Elizabethkingia]MCT3689550.1 hypothetical protein [Elizabethkingia anophelis]MCT3706361.1 hypothetical protein [Elizabethkingia anophelis]MCT3713380.1 hypothetical protein [Elizabethkingia anophelis]MCT3716798.1 hypothetical protein [Elizabethkingia anophelis]MCT3730443.1 hypothetical protein [Elizabethkingia anophelis]
MKTKYVKVPVSERLPDTGKDVILISEHEEKGEGYITESENWCIYGNSIKGKLIFWLEEKEDHSEEMLSLLEFIKGYGAKCDWNKLEKDIEELINKVKP